MFEGRLPFYSLKVKSGKQIIETFHDSRALEKMQHGMLAVISVISLACFTIQG